MNSPRARTRAVLWGVIASAVLLSASRCYCRSGPATSAPENHWKALFNGHDLSGWEVVNAGRWTVEDGAIVMRRKPNEWGGGWLVTKQDYGNFILRLKFKPGADVFNSGILVRDPGHAKTTRPALNGFEIKVAQGDRVENANATIWYVASAYLHTIPAQQWTTFEVRCIGDHITTYMNGEKMAETHTRRSYKGAIGLHLHGGHDQPECRWRDIEVLELPAAPCDFQLAEEKLAQSPGEFRPLLNTNLPLGGLRSRSGDAAAWVFQDGVLRGTGGNRESILATNEMYADFVLSFEFKAKSGGDAVLEFRVPQTLYRSASIAPPIRKGYEFNIADGDEVNPTASLIDVGRAFMLDASLARVYHPGNWNQAQIYATEDHLIVYLNLMKEVDVYTPTAACKGRSVSA